jgi:hypothetical protein
MRIDRPRAREGGAQHHVRCAGSTRSRASPKRVKIKLNGKELRRKKSFSATLPVTQLLKGAKPKQGLEKNVKFKE